MLYWMLDADSKCGRPVIVVVRRLSYPQLNRYTSPEFIKCRLELRKMRKAQTINEDCLLKFQLELKTTSEIFYTENTMHLVGNSHWHKNSVICRWALELMPKLRTDFYGSVSQLRVKSVRYIENFLIGHEVSREGEECRTRKTNWVLDPTMCLSV